MSSNASHPKAPAAFRKQVMTLLGENFGDRTLVLCPTAFVALLDGDHKAAILLSQILYWSDRTKDTDGWFYKSYADWHAETGLSEAQVRRILNGDPRVSSPRRTLRALGIETLLRKVKRTGAPTLHYRVNQPQFLASLASFMGQGDPQQCAGSILDNAGDQSLAESAINPVQSAASLIPAQTNSTDFVAEDQPSQTPADEDSDETLFNAFENRFGKLKDPLRAPLSAEVTRLGATKVREVLARCATRGRSWNYVLKALANEQAPSAMPSSTGSLPAEWAYATSAADLPAAQLAEHEPKSEPEIVVSERVETRWAGGHSLFPTVRAAWEAALHQIELQFGSDFHSWGRGLTLVDYEPESAALLIVTRSAYTRDLLQTRLYRSFKRIVGDVSGQPVALRFLLREEWAAQGRAVEQIA